MLITERLGACMIDAFSPLCRVSSQGFARAGLAPPQAEGTPSWDGGTATATSLLLFVSHRGCTPLPAAGPGSVRIE